MAFSRSVLFFVLVSLFAALGLFLAASVIGQGGFRGGYAVLSADASVEDRLLRELLDSGRNNYGGSPVSESSQWVILDEFGSFEVVPLDKFSSRLFPFDPRNDGYAAKLKNVFVRGDKRFVYIPLKAGNWAASSLDRQFREMLADIPFSVDYFGSGSPVSLFFVLYACSSLAILVICYAKRKIHGNALCIIALLPSLSSLAFFGAAGIAVCALVLGVSVILKEPAGELVTFLRAKGAAHSAAQNSAHSAARNFKAVYKEAVEPYLHYWLCLPPFAAAAVIITVFSQLKLFFVLLVFAAVLGISFLSAGTSRLWEASRKRFTPVQIIRQKFPGFSFSLYMAPFAVAAFLSLLLAPYVSGSFFSSGEFDPVLVDERDYYAHLAFQTSFSTRQLGGTDSSYPGYTGGENGLPYPDKTSSSIPSAGLEHFPPFPLKHLMDFFAGVNSRDKTSSNGGIFTEGANIGVTAGATGGAGAKPLEFLPVLILLLFILPGLFLGGKTGFPPRWQFSGLKQWTDIKRKKVLLYNNKNTLRLQRETFSLLARWRQRKDA
jgi:hypothetical protein